MPFILENSLLQAARTIRKRSSRFAAHQQARSFQRSSKRCLPKGSRDDPRASNDATDPPSPAEDSIPVRSLPNGHPEFAVAKVPPKDLIYYGSATRRQQRARSSQDTDSLRRVQRWFLEFNVRLQEELRPSKSQHGMQHVLPNGHGGYIGLQRREAEDESGGEANRQSSLKGYLQDIFSEPQQDTSQRMDARHPDPLTGKGYFLSLPQFMEVYYTAMGLMRPPMPAFANTVAASKSHLILHCAHEGGTYFLGKVVEDLAYGMDCDLITLDAQDIAELVTTDDYLDSPTQDTWHNARWLSYEVYHKHFEAETNNTEEETDYLESEQDDAAPPKGVRLGSTMIKPVVLNLSDLLPSALGASAMRGRSRIPRVSNGFFESDPSLRPKPTKQIVASLVNDLVSAAQLKRASQQHVGQPSPKYYVPSTAETIALASGDSPSKPGLIIHINDLKAIQDVRFGSQFLTALYDNVQTRRADGERVLLVGTETPAENSASYSKSHINEMQTLDPDVISRTIILTPITPNMDSKLALLEDKKKRIRTVNMRHIWEQYQEKLVDVMQQLPPGFRQLDPIEYISLLTWSSLEKGFLSFGEIHRVTSLFLGMSETLKIGPREILRAFQYLAASDESKVEWADKQNAENDPSTGSSDSKSTEHRLNKIRDSATKYEKRLLGGVIEPDRIKTTFNDVHAPVETVDALKTLTTLSLIRPDAFLYGVLASDKIPGLLLYGPPGTGKTLLAKAVAKESGATVLEVSGAEINDMYVGEGEKNIKALFSLAKKLSPSVIFIDEADALFSARSGGHQRVSHRELLNQFLKEWDGMSNDAGGAFIMVATNRPMDLDDAVLRRLPRRLLVDLPAENDRLEILKIHLRHEQLAADVNLADLASKTPFYSGSDLKNLSVAAALACVREENDLAKMHKGDDPYQHAEKRTLTAAHFTRALEEISASISEDMASLKDIKKFDEQYGDKRGKKKKMPKWGFRTVEEASRVLDTVKVRA